MDQTSWITVRDLAEVESVLRLQRRGPHCVDCNKADKLECPTCPDGQTCRFTVPTDCSQCAQSVCSPIDDSDDGDSGGGGGGKSGPSAGPIAGGVIGGIIVIAILTYLVWRFLIKPKRSADASVYEPESNSSRHIEKDDQSRMTRRSSTHTVHSIASTVLTRASNIIQIAYIPGVTNRATPTSPTVLVPPVPPIPMHHADGHSDLEQDDQHYFVPGNLRDSTYSGISNYTDTTNYARGSYAPRSSIASTIYGKQAQVQTPAQTGMRAKPTVVSVKSGPAGGNTPPVPDINFEKFNSTRPKSGASAFSVGSTFLNSANTATQARAQVVKVGGLKQIDISSKRPEPNSSANSFASVPASDRIIEVQTPTSASSLMGDQGPFSDNAARLSPQPGLGTPSLGAVIEDEGEHSRDGSRMSQRSGSSGRGRSPFSDAHAMRQ